MNIQEKLAELRYLTAQYGLPPDRPPILLGPDQADAVLGGGLKPGVLHEIFAGDWGAGGFALCLALRAMGKKPLFFIQTDYAALEYGALAATGFLELGGDPQKLFLLSAANAQDALSAAADILSCPAMGVVVLELEGRVPLLDLKASRRLNLLAEESGVTLILLREGALPRPSAAVTRWDVRSHPSRAHDDWGGPRFLAKLARNRLGALGEWIMEWNPQHGIFQQETAHPGLVAQAPSHRPAHALHAQAG